MSCGPRSRAHLYQLKNGHRKAGASLAYAIEQFSKRPECVRLGLPPVRGVELVAEHNRPFFAGRP